MFSNHSVLRTAYCLSRSVLSWVLKVMVWVRGGR